MVTLKEINREVDSLIRKYSLSNNGKNRGMAYAHRSRSERARDGSRMKKLILAGRVLTCCESESQLRAELSKLKVLLFNKEKEIRKHLEVNKIMFSSKEKMKKESSRLKSAYGISKIKNQINSINIVLEW
jgi:hypothetical protein